jgi:pyridoxal phosphate enzyme (YggS family)
MPSWQAILAANLAAVESRLQAACARARRPRSDVMLVAVTKTVSATVARALVDLGLHDLGESRPQELWSKAAVLPSSIRWHLIGHLQRNKIDRTMPLVHRLHSVDSLRLLSALEEFGKPLDVFLEFNASGEQTKQGFAPAELPTLATVLKTLRHVRVTGLMTMAAPEEDPERCRPTFQHLRASRDRLRQSAGPAHSLADLSMGMSNDFEVAVEEGATLIRLGSILFEGVAE